LIPFKLMPNHLTAIQIREVKRKHLQRAWFAVAVDLQKGFMSP
jgi:hypothetical protein